MRKNRSPDGGSGNPDAAELDRALLRSGPGDCCVFCSYGSVKCPPMQSAGQ